MHRIGLPETGQLPNVTTHRASSMTAHQVQDYMSRLVEQHQVFGEQYVARQLAWAEAELIRVGGVA